MRNRKIIKVTLAIEYTDDESLEAARDSARSITEDFDCGMIGGLDPDQAVFSTYEHTSATF